MSSAPPAVAAAAPAVALPRLRLLPFWLILALLWFGPLNTPHLFEPDEGRYAEIPREMVVSGDWVTPRLDDIKYFEKPALQYWATAIAYELFGQHAWTARLWPALCGYLGLLLTFWLGLRLYDQRTALAAVLVQAGALLYLGLARITTLDMSLCFGLQLGLSALALMAQQRGARHSQPLASPTRPALRPWQLSVMLGAGMAVAVLSKGLVGILIPCAAAGLYLIWQWDWWIIIRARPWWSLAVLVVLAAPWFLLVSARNPEFAHFFFIVQHFQRFLSTAGFDRYQPAWFFVPTLLLGLLPWTTLLPGALRQALRDVRAGRPAAALLLSWTVFVFAFFSASHSKLIPYILPLFPAAALLTARHAMALSAAALARHLVAVAAFAAIVCAGLLLLWQLPPAAGLVARASTASVAALIAGFGLLALAAGFGAWRARRLLPLEAVVAAALGSWLLAQCLLLAADKLPRMDTLVQLERRGLPWIGNSTHFYCVHDYLQPLPFYWRHTCTLVGYAGELEFGLKQEPWRWLPDLQRFAAAWQADSNALAILPPDDYRRLSELGLPMRVIYTSQSLVAVVRR